MQTKHLFSAIYALAALILLLLSILSPIDDSLEVEQGTEPATLTFQPGAPDDLNRPNNHPLANATLPDDPDYAFQLSPRLGSSQ